MRFSPVLGGPERFRPRGISRLEPGHRLTAGSRGFTNRALDSIGGDDGNRTLNVQTPAGAQTTTLTPGSTADAGAVQVGSLVPMNYTNLGTAGVLVLVDGDDLAARVATETGNAAIRLGVEAIGGKATGRRRASISSPTISGAARNGRLCTASVAANTSISRMAR